MIMRRRGRERRGRRRGGTGIVGGGLLTFSFGILPPVLALLRVRALLRGILALRSGRRLSGRRMG
jgi:hypothetical protein